MDALFFSSLVLSFVNVREIKMRDLNQNKFI